MTIEACAHIVPRCKTTGLGTAFFISLAIHANVICLMFILYIDIFNILDLLAIPFLTICEFNADILKVCCISNNVNKQFSHKAAMYSNEVSSSTLLLLLSEFDSLGTNDQHDKGRVNLNMGGVRIAFHAAKENRSWMFLCI